MVMIIVAELNKKNARTIQGELEKAFFGICHQKI